MSLPARLAAHTRIATSLDLLSDLELAERVAAGTPLGTGIGGSAVRITVEGGEVFVKRVPLTGLERRPDHVRSTANPSACRRNSTTGSAPPAAPASAPGGNSPCTR